MDKGRFYFISEDFFNKFDMNHDLMQNKEHINGVTTGRPCFMAFPDDKDGRIFWCIPISSKVEKYKRIVARKAQNRINKNLPPKECDTIRFCEVLGQERAFLIQNIFPITSTYILGKYVDKNSGHEVRIAQNAERDIIAKAHKVLKLHRNGVKLVFGDINKIYRGLAAELQLRITAPNT